MFAPLHRDHAIETVILRLTGSGEMAEHERPNLDRGYEKYWKVVLPMVKQAQMMEIAMGPMPIVEGAPKPLAPTQYIEFMRTGKAAWWMEIAGPTVTVGCAQYSGWKSARRKACELFNNVGATLGKGHPLGQLRSAELTYQDLLLWDGADDEYDAKLAIQESRIPPQARRSKEWHVEQGWVVDPEGERILERFQVGAVLRKNGNEVKPAIQVVTTVIWGFGGNEVRMHLDRAFGNVQSVDGSDRDGRVMYDSLHSRTHALFRTLITKEIAQRIGLEEAREQS